MRQRDFGFWQRRLSANTQPLPQGDLKLLLSTVIKEMENLREEIQSLRSKGTPRSSKKLDPKDRTSEDS